MTAVVRVLVVAEWVAFAAATPGVAELLVFRPTPWFGTGRHVSRPLRHRVGVGAEWLRVALWIYLFVGLFVDVGYLGRVVGVIVFYVWVADDYWFGDRPRGRRIREWAKAKLRKTKPVMRRLAERWKPVPPRRPVPA